MTGRNRAILEHSKDRRALRGFQGAGGVVTYLGEFELDPDQPFYIQRTPETRSNTLRNAIVFRLHLIDETGTIQPEPSSTVLLSTAYRPAKQKTGTLKRDPFEVDPNLLDRRTGKHQELQDSLERFIRSQRGQTRSPGALDPEFDLAWHFGGGSFVAEVKTVTPANQDRQLRMGLGQILHYQDMLRRSGVPTQCVLFVELPQESHWVELCAEHGVKLVWPSNLAEVLSLKRDKGQRRTTSGWRGTDQGFPGRLRRSPFVSTTRASQLELMMG
jgi:hypothetical protein